MTPLFEWVDAHRDEMLAFLKRVVDIESPSDDKTGVDAVGAVFQQAYRGLGCAVRLERQTQYGDHVVAETPAQRGPRVLLVGHMDTVYPVGTIGARPFTVRAGRATGPAVMDMKGGLVVMLFALRALVENGGLGNARIVLNSDEEPGSPTSRDGWPARAADVDWAFVLEPGKADGSLVSRRKGVGIFRLTVAGRAAHAGAEPEEGANAIVALAHLALAATAVARPDVGTTLNVGTVRGGTHPYVVPERAEAGIDIRVSTIAEAERAVGELNALVARSLVAGTTASLGGFFHRPPLEEVKGTDALKTLVTACGEDVGLRARYVASGGASDGNNIAAAGVPTLDGMGPAGGGAHSENEWMDVESFYQKTKLLALVLRRLWSGAIPA